LQLFYYHLFPSKSGYMALISTVIPNLNIIRPKKIVILSYEGVKFNFEGCELQSRDSY
jgi:hypothetical protein